MYKLVLIESDRKKNKVYIKFKYNTQCVEEKKEEYIIIKIIILLLSKEKNKNTISKNY